MPEPRPKRPANRQVGGVLERLGYDKLLTLLQRARGNYRYREEFIEACRPLVALVIRSSLNDHSEHEAIKDLTQEALVKIFQSFDSIRSQTAIELGTFIGELSRNVVRDFFRQKQRQPVALAGLPGYDEELTEAKENPDNVIHQAYNDALVETDFSSTLLDQLSAVAKGSSLSGLIETAIGKLKPQYQEVIRLHYFEEKEIVEMAKIIGVREGTVKSRLARARRQLENFLRRELKPEGRSWRLDDFLIYQDGELLPVDSYGKDETVAVESIRYLREKHGAAFITAQHAREVFKKGPQRPDRDERVLAGLFWATTQRRGGVGRLFRGSWGKLQQLAEENTKLEKDQLN